MFVLGRRAGDSRAALGRGKKFCGPRSDQRLAVAIVGVRLVSQSSEDSCRAELERVASDLPAALAAEHQRRQSTCGRAAQDAGTLAAQEALGLFEKIAARRRGCPAPAPGCVAGTEPVDAWFWDPAAPPITKSSSLAVSIMLCSRSFICGVEMGEGAAKLKVRCKNRSSARGVRPLPIFPGTPRSSLV